MSIRSRVSFYELDDSIVVNFWNPATKTIVATEDNEWRAANKLGMSHRKIKGILTKKGRAYHPGLKMEVAVRYGRK
jgi:hypothetical protein